MLHHNQELQTSDPSLYTVLHRKNIIKKVVGIVFLFKILDVPSLSLVPSPRTTNSLTEAREQDSTFSSIDKLNIYSDAIAYQKECRSPK
jgi:hypothetical protein